MSDLKPTLEQRIAKLTANSFQYASAGDVRALVEALQSPSPVPVVPEGWQLVPKVPTDEWLEQMVGGPDFTRGGAATMWKQAYAAMLAAAPKPGVPR